jgi:hypothetical protein
MLHGIIFHQRATLEFPNKLRDYYFTMNDPNPHPFPAAKSKLESSKTGSNAKNQRDGHATHLCEEFNAEYGI